MSTKTGLPLYRLLRQRDIAFGDKRKLPSLFCGLTRCEKRLFIYLFITLNLIIQYRIIPEGTEAAELANKCHQVGLCRCLSALRHITYVHPVTFLLPVSVIFNSFSHSSYPFTHTHPRAHPHSRITSKIIDYYSTIWSTSVT